MDEKKQPKRRTSDQILFAEREELNKKIAGLMKVQRLLDKADTLHTQISTQVEELMGLGMSRARIASSLQTSQIGLKLLKTKPEPSPDTDRQTSQNENETGQENDSSSNWES